MRISPVCAIGHKRAIIFLASSLYCNGFPIQLFILSLLCSFLLLLSNGHVCFAHCLTHSHLSELIRAGVLCLVFTEYALLRSVFTTEFLAAWLFDNRSIEDVRQPFHLLAGRWGVSVRLIQGLVAPVEVIECARLESRGHALPRALLLLLGSCLHSDVILVLIEEDVRILVGGAKNLCGQRLLIKQPVSRFGMDLISCYLPAQDWLRDIHWSGSKNIRLVGVCQPHFRTINVWCVGIA